MPVAPHVTVALVIRKDKANVGTPANQGLGWLSAACNNRAKEASPAVSDDHVAHVNYWFAWSGIVPPCHCDGPTTRSRIVQDSTVGSTKC